MSQKLIIESRFCGMPHIANGGYVCGLVARLIDGTAEVTLRRPPPLNQPLELEQLEANKVVLRHGNVILAEARPTNIELDVPTPPTYAEAEKATKQFEANNHPFPTCFVCGPDRAESDGLRILPGQVSGKDFVAATWIPDTSLSDDVGKIRREFHWAALDCPAAWAIVTLQNRFIVMGKFAAQIDNWMKPLEKYIVIGWQISITGRKIYAGTALFSESGKLFAKAKSTWIELNHPA